MLCKKCNTEKSFDDFYTSSKTRCKDCIKESTHANRLLRIDHYRQYDRMRASMPHRKELAKEVMTEWKSKHPNRRAANIKVGNAVRDGKLKKQPCWVCGSGAVAHHPDYDRPLDVVWLCQSHHKQAHALAEAA